MASIQESYELAVHYLNDGLLRKAIEVLRAAHVTINNWDYQNRLNSIADNYQLLLNYFRKGVADNERTKLYNEFICQTYGLADSILRDSLETNSDGEYYAQLRSIHKRKLDLIPLLKRLDQVEQDLIFAQMTADNLPALKDKLARKEALVDDLFNLEWTSQQWTSEEEAAITDFVQHSSNDNLACLSLVSAVMLAILSYFDIGKFAWLCRQSANSDAAISERALVGVVLILLCYQERLPYYKSAVDALNQILQTPEIGQRLTDIQLSLLNVYNSKNVQRKIQEEILPSIYKNRQSGLDMSKLDELMNDDVDDGEMLDNDELKRLQRNINDLSEMQKDGADMPLITFSHFKHFPFFYPSAHWFYPFVDNYSEFVGNEILQNDFFRNFMQANVLCDSDCYSFALMISSMPPAQWEMMKQGIETQLNEQDLNKVFIERDKRNRSTLERLHVQDCYRYFTLYADQHQGNASVINPFQHDIILSNLPMLASVFTDMDSLLKIAYFAYKQHLWQQAVDVFQYIDSHFSMSLQALRLYGYSLERLKLYSKAIICYEKALVIDGQSMWTLRHLGLCQLRIGNLQEASNIFFRLTTTEPDNTAYIQHYAETLALLGRYEQALTQFFKLEYQNAKSEPALRGIAWCSLLCGKQTQSLTYYTRIPQDHLSIQDRRNMGHANLLCGNIDQAISYYKSALSQAVDPAPSLEENNERKSVFQFFPDEVQLLNSNGISQINLQFVTDLVNQ